MIKEKPIHILLVEDDETLCFIIKDNLEQNGYIVHKASGGNEGLLLFSREEIHLCLLDIMLPEADGFTVAKKIREQDEHVPIIFLTARSMTEDKIKGLSMGGDDYLTKPFSMEELLLKIKIFLKRSYSNNLPDDNQQFILGKYRFDFESLTLELHGKKRALTMKEAQLLKMFCQNRNRVLNRSHILKQIWGSDDYYLGRSLDVFISRLRKYLKEDAAVKITNLHGVGFRMTDGKVVE